MTDEWTSYTRYKKCGDDDWKSHLTTKRVTYGISIDTVLSSSNDLAIAIFTTTEFVEFANELVMKALSKKGLPSKIPLEILTKPVRDEHEELVVALWRFDKVLNWQMVDRRIDEYVYFLIVYLSYLFFTIMTWPSSFLRLSESAKSFGHSIEATNASAIPNLSLAWTTSRRMSPSVLSGHRKWTKVMLLCGGWGGNRMS